MSDGQRLQGRQKYMLFVLMLVYACHLIDRTIVLVLLDPIKHEYGLSDTQLGLFSGFIFATGALAAAIPLGTLADRRSRKSILAACIAVWSLMTLLCGSAWSYASLLLMRFGVGAAEAGLQPTALSMVADEVPVAQRAKAVSIVHLGIPLGTLIGFFAGGWIASTLGWRWALLIVGVPGLVLALIVALTLREPPRQEAATKEEAPSLGAFLSMLWRDKALLHVVFGIVVLWFCTSSVSAWLASFLVRSHQVPIATVGMIMAGTVCVGGALGNLVSGALSERVAKGRLDRLAIIAVVGALGGYPLYLIVLTSGSLAVVVVALTLHATFYFLTFTPAYSLVMSIAPPLIRGRTAALMSMGATVAGYGLGSQTTGILSDLMYPAFGRESLRYALIVIVTSMLWSTAHLVIVAIKLRTRQSAENVLVERDFA